LRKLFLQGGEPVLTKTIKAIAAKRNESIPEVERGANIGRNTIYKWDKSSPSVEKIKAVADYLGVTVDELLKEGGKE
jgi:transcriptional regulator with XRE-family HTH domain